MGRWMIIVGMACAAACGSSGGTRGDGSSGSDGGGGGVTIEKACADIAMASCTKRATCTNGASITRLYGTMDVCLQRITGNCLSSAMAPGTGVTPAATEACVAAYNGFSCSDFFANNVPAECIHAGSRANGAACAFNGQCMSAFCSIPKGVQCGTCADPPAPGASCGDGGCAHGQICVSTTQVCTVPGVSGAACNKDNPCAFGLACVGSSSTTMGTCQTAGNMTGEACDYKNATKASCDFTQGYECNTMSMTCQPVMYAMDGQPCAAQTTGDYVLCYGDGFCAIPMGSKTGTCKAPAMDGQPCDTALGPGCLPPARCITGGGTATAGVCKVNDGSLCM